MDSSFMTELTLVHVDSSQNSAQNVGEICSAFRPQRAALRLHDAVDLFDQMQQAADVRLADAQRSFDAGLRKEAGVGAEFDAELVAKLVVETRGEADEGHRHGREFPFG